jgi:D-3-phosphoglycerate dehydrogenase / 2-oxoglutarate reductase
MTDLTSRVTLWREQATRVAVAGGQTSSLSPATRARLDEAPIELIQRPLREPDGSVAREVAEADVLISGGAPIDAATFGQLGRVRFVLRPYVGYDDIDVDGATQHGVLFANVPDTFIEEVANQTLAMILAANRYVVPMDAFVRSGRWSAGERARGPLLPVHRPSHMTLGLVGFGNIGRLVAERARPFGFKMLAADPYVQPEVAAAMGVQMVELDELMAQSDVVSLHVFLNAQTRGLIDARRLSLMKQGAYLVNTSRGPVVDETALIEALRSGHLSGAGLDVFEREPVLADNPLLSMDNVLLSPHIASYSIEGDALHQQRIADIVLHVVRGNMPERKVVVNKDLYDQIAGQLQLAPTPG